MIKKYISRIGLSVGLLGILGTNINLHFGDSFVSTVFLSAFGFAVFMAVVED